MGVITVHTLCRCVEAVAHPTEPDSCWGNKKKKKTKTYCLKPKKTSGTDLGSSAFLQSSCEDGAQKNQPSAQSVRVRNLKPGSSI